MQNVVPFAELCLRTGVEFYAYTAHYHEIVQATVFVDIVKVINPAFHFYYFFCFFRYF